ncbi:unnamed protein product [Caenorhabditis sp. 36 PRJEB53466]|nr:unnamed protein product [Caenorhabditis sp. 36 PRJEB53466]
MKKEGIQTRNRKMSTKEARKIKNESTGSNSSASLGMTTPTAAGLTSNLDLADPSSVWGMKSTQPMLMATPTAYSFPTSNYFFTGGPTLATRSKEKSFKLAKIERPITMKKEGIQTRNRKMSTKEARKIKKESTGSNGSASLGMTTPTAAGLTSNLDLADPSSVWDMKSTQPMLMATPTAYSFPTSNYFFTGGAT